MWLPGRTIRSTGTGVRLLYGGGVARRRGAMVRGHSRIAFIGRALIRIHWRRGGGVDY